MREPCTCSPTLQHCPACLAWRTHGAATIRAILGTIEAEGDEARDATAPGHPVTPGAARRKAPGLQAASEGRIRPCHLEVNAPGRVR
jgi:hypothetical protein